MINILSVCSRRRRKHEHEKERDKDIRKDSNQTSRDRNTMKKKIVLNEISIKQNTIEEKTSELEDISKYLQTIKLSKMKH